MTAQRRTRRDLLLVYRVRSREEAVFGAELDALVRARGGRVVYLDSSAGRFTPELFADLVLNLVDRDVFLCGPPPMAGAVRDCLRRAGLPDSRLHEERFEL